MQYIGMDIHISNLDFAVVNDAWSASTTFAG